MPGSRNEKRWQDVEELLAAGIDVISTVNIQHLESLNDVVERITGIRQRETVPDRVVRAADQIELVDMTPEALRRRMAHGNIYAADKVDAALGNYFRAGNLSALRELALLWVADRVDDAMQDYRERHGITATWETRERVVVALSGAPDRHPADPPGRADRPAGEGRPHRGARDRRQRTLRRVEQRWRVGDRRATAPARGARRRPTAGSRATTSARRCVEVARSENATQIVLGASARSWWHELANGSVINRVVRRSGPIDVHVISADRTIPTRSRRRIGERRLPAVKPVLTPLSPRRQAWGWVIALVGLPGLTVLFANARDTFSLPTRAARSTSCWRWWSPSSVGCSPPPSP